MHRKAAATAQRAQSSESCGVLPDLWRTLGGSWRYALLMLTGAFIQLSVSGPSSSGRSSCSKADPALKQLCRRALLRGGRLRTLTTPFAFLSFAARRTSARSRSRTTSSLARSVSSAPRRLLFASPATTSRSVLASRRRALALRAPTSTRSARGPARSTSAASS